MSDGCDGLGQISNLATADLTSSFVHAGTQENLQAAGLDCAAYGDFKNLEANYIQRHPHQMNTSSTFAVICLCFIEPHHSFQVRSIPIAFD